MADINGKQGANQTLTGLVQIPLWPILTAGMVRTATADIAVQIPLWPILTLWVNSSAYLFSGSDSSMADINPDVQDWMLDEILFRFLYGRY